MFNESSINEVAGLIRCKGGVVALTGAGISVDSGIPDFRSPHGLWTKYDPMEYATIQAFKKNPAKVWNFFLDLEPLKNSKPNKGHEALKALEDMGFLSDVITQNIDSLHTTAGNTKVIELHGNTRALHCIECFSEFCLGDFRHVAEKDLPPKCPSCGGLVKPAVILFGEPLPMKAIEMATKAASKAKILLTVGTSGLVSPANIFPTVAKEHGAVIVEVNLEKTTLTQTITDYFLMGSSSKILPELVSALADNHRNSRSDQALF